MPSDAETRPARAFARCELQLCPERGQWRLECLGADGQAYNVLSDQPADAELLPLLPDGTCELLVGNCALPPPLRTKVV